MSDDEIEAEIQESFRSSPDPKIETDWEGWARRCGEWRAAWAGAVCCGHCGRLKFWARGDWRHGWQGCPSGVQGWPENANRRESIPQATPNKVD